MNAAFNASEASAILLSTITNNKLDGTPGGVATQDKVFLLNFEEAGSYLPTSTSRIALNTPYAKAQGSEEFTPGLGCWWLRVPYKPVGDDGYWDRGFAECDVVIGIRPAIWLKLE